MSDLTTREFATRLGVGYNTVKRHLGGDIPVGEGGAYQTPGGHWRFPEGLVEAVRQGLAKKSEADFFDLGRCG